MDKLIISRMNRVLEVEPDPEHHSLTLTLTRYSGRITVTGSMELESFLTVRESSVTRMWELIDALTQPDVLHPIFRDIKISPFGDDGTIWLHVKWEGWHADEIEVLDTTPDMKDLLEALMRIETRSRKLKEELVLALREEMSENTKAEFIRKVALFLTDCIAQLLPENPYPARGLLAAPFRKLTLGHFNNSDSLSIRLSPSEARKLARVVEMVSRR
jgi:hypothetical protein